jgi:hypothetical protein
MQTNNILKSASFISVFVEWLPDTFKKKRYEQRLTYLHDLSAVRVENESKVTASLDKVLFCLELHRN